MNSPGLIAILLAYVAFCGFILFFCVFSDPEQSDMAHLMQVALPNKIWSQMTKVMGEKKMDVFQAILDRAMVLVYLAIVLGSWVIVFWYIYPWISRSSHVSNVHKFVGYFVFVACFGSWRLANTSSPGIITTRTFKKYDHYPYDNLLFLPGRHCETTNLIKIPRSKFDRLKYDRNVPRYDHFCGWVFNTIGENNYRWFLLFLAVHVLMCAYCSVVTMALFRGEIIDKRLLELTFFDRATGEHVKSNWHIVFQYLFTRQMLELSMLAVVFVLGITLLFFLAYHIYLTSVNQTTNEAGKWSDITRWYKSQQKKHKEAVKKGLFKPADTTAPAEAPKVQDGDVTCTGSSKQPTQQQPPPQQENFDPGPIPKNMYDRGFVENWKEVLFPISLRKNALEVGGFSRPKTSQSGESKPQAQQPNRSRPKPSQQTVAPNKSAAPNKTKST